MGRILAIDYGKKRTGLAVTDPLQIIATGLDAVDTVELMPFLKTYIAKEQVDKLIIGYPEHSDGTPMEICVDINKFVKAFSKQYPGIEVSLADERYTSKMAVRALVEGGANKKTRRDKKMIDKISAVIILQNYLQNPAL